MTSPRPLLLRGAVATPAVTAPLVLAADGTARLITDEPPPIGATVTATIDWPTWPAPVRVAVAVVGGEAAGAPGERAAWRLELAPGPARDRLVALVTSTAAAPPAAVRVLLVEDSALVADAFRWGLARHLGPRATAVTVDVAGDAATGWALATAHAYDLLIVDHFLPDGSGADLIARLRAAAAPLPPVIAVSRGAAAVAGPALAAGADLFLAKPLALAELFSTVELCLAKGAPPMPTRILLMDDSELFLDVVGGALDRAGYQVTRVSDLAALGEHPAAVDLVLLDVQMPEAFGDDLGMVLHHVRGSAAAIYLLSSLPTDELARRAAEAGLDGYISKHVGVDAVVARVGEIAAALPGGP